jgi:hypothetical protein
LNAHLSAVHQFMPGLRIQRDGETQQCQGTILARWIVTKTDGSQAAKGANIFHLSPSGRILRITGFWE